MSDATRVTSFFALVEQKRKLTAQVINADAGLRAELTSTFEQQAQEFLAGNPDRISFDPRFKPDTDHIFEINAFVLPDSVKQAVERPNELLDLKLSSTDYVAIKGVFGVGRSGDSTRILFQRSNRARVFRPGSVLSFSSGVFKRLEDPGLSLDTSLVAVYESGTLTFRTFAAVNPIIDLKEYFVEATDEEVKAVLAHDTLIVEDESVITKLCDMSMRKRFTYIKTRNVLDSASPKAVCAGIKQYFSDIDISYSNKGGAHRLKMPTKKKDLKRLLNYLCDHYYVGEISQQKLETNSHRSIG
ncbi:hypothetical protein [Paludisphaera rhizosphaerae]|uniref:hypothetical protein n=1 Tax=Paludisphaera rhizosphaerae TaxID=2711216 RepID=UPI0013EA44AD|nr:hypothetical protein [Paludisphaera rhizosphaerae]